MKGFLRSKLVLSLAALILIAAAIAVPLSGSITHSHAASSIPWNIGDVFVGVSHGQYNVYDNTGAFKDSVNDGQGGFTTGCAFNGGLDKLYTTNFSNTKVEVYDNAIPHTLSQTVDTAANGGSNSESVVFASNGDFYVGNAGANAILRYNAAGTFQQSYAAATEDRGTDWLDLASDQKTIFYTSEGGRIMRFNVSGAGAQLADFANIGGISYALRLLPPGDGSGGLLVANSTTIKRLDGAGNVVQTYDAPGEDSWFALNLDPNGKSFWAGDFTTGDFFRFNLATGAVEVGPINTGTGPGTLFGICVKGEPAAALPPQKLFILLQGIDTSLSQQDVDMNGGLGAIPDFENTNNNVPGIRPFLKSKFPNAQFLAFSYLSSNPDNGHPFPYYCLSTFQNSISFDALLLGNQIASYLKTQPQNTITDIYLIGHSLGGTVALAYLTALLNAPGKVTPIPANGHLAGVITLDSPVGGVSSNNGFLNFTFSHFQEHGGGLLGCAGLTDRKTQFTSVQNLANLFDTTSQPTSPAPDDNNSSQGAHASILKAIFNGQALTNQGLVETAAAQGIPVLTIGNTIDYLYNPSACPFAPSVNFTTSQWIDDEGPNESSLEGHSPSIAVYGREFTAGQGCISSALFHLINHKVVYNTTAVETALSQFLPKGGQPVALLEAPPELS